MEEHKNAYKVLIADDDPVVHQSLNAYFKRENFTTASAFDGEKALELAAQYGFTAILNDAPELGVSRTIFLGTQAMLDCDAILYMVADQPLLQPNSVCAVAERWTREPGCIVGAAHNAKRGNPCIFPKKFFPELLALTGDTGGSRVIRQHEELLRLVEIPPEELYDCDTKRALDALKASTGAS